jgi:hypothetical protein
VPRAVRYYSNYVMLLGYPRRELVGLSVALMLFWLRKLLAVSSAVSSTVLLVRLKAAS